MDLPMVLTKMVRLWFQFYSLCFDMVFCFGFYGISNYYWQFNARLNDSKYYYVLTNNSIKKSVNCFYTQLNNQNSFYV